MSNWISSLAEAQDTARGFMGSRSPAVEEYAAALAEAGLVLVALGPEVADSPAGAVVVRACALYSTEGPVMSWRVSWPVSYGFREARATTWSGWRRASPRRRPRWRREADRERA